MKIFTQTLYAFIIVSIATTLVMTAHYLEKYRNKATELEVIAIDNTSQGIYTIGDIKINIR